MAFSALTGVPVFTYATAGLDNDQDFTLISTAYESDYLVTATSSSSSGDSVSIPNSQTFSVLAAFTLTDHAGVDQKIYMMRDPQNQRMSYTGIW